QRGEALHDGRPAPGERLALGARDLPHLGDVVAGAERPPAPGDEQHARVVQPGHASEGVLERVGDRPVQRVERVGTVEGQARDALACLVEQDEVGHADGGRRLSMKPATPTASAPSPAATPAAAGQKLVRNTGTREKTDRCRPGACVPSSSPSTIAIASVMSTSVVARAKAGSASAGWPT